MSVEKMVLAQGMADTRATLERWNADAWPVMRRWVLLSAATAVGLLASVIVVSHAVTPDATPLRLPGDGIDPSWHAAFGIIGRNLLVLALHAMACVAGFIAGTSMPQLAAARSGFSRALHEHAGRFAILFVAAATCFSLATQAYVLGSVTSTLSYQHHVAAPLLIVALLPHALPELTALFLPLAAWTLASRRGEWNELLAATFVTTALALPVLMLSAIVEVWVSPHVLDAIAG